MDKPLSVAAKCVNVGDLANEKYRYFYISEKKSKSSTLCVKTVMPSSPIPSSLLTFVDVFK